MSFEIISSNRLEDFLKKDSARLKNELARRIDPIFPKYKKTAESSWKYLDHFNKDAFMSWYKSLIDEVFAKCVKMRRENSELRIKEVKAITEERVDYVSMSGKRVKIVVEMES